MGGQRSSSKALKLVCGAIALVISVFVFYGYSQALNDAKSKSQHLKEAREEYLAISRRFDMLSNELKGEFTILRQLLSWSSCSI